MYFRILKKDIKRKRTMNLILLIFVILAAVFIAGSANNLITVSSALDDFLKKANAPDYLFATMNRSDLETFGEFAEKNGYDYHVSRFIQIDPAQVRVEGEKLNYSNTLALSTLGGVRIFNKNNKEITQVKDGEIYVTSMMFQSKENNFREGGKIVIKQGDVEKEFTIRGYMKDVLFGSDMMGMTRFLVSERDAQLFDGDTASICNLVTVYTKDTDYGDKFNKLGMDTVMSINSSVIKMSYFMDVLMSAVLMVVSVCLILISMVILRFIIHFTITEEFREIGVMKAIGIEDSAVRGLYLAKYFAIAIVGTVVGIVFSIPFSRLMLASVAKKMILLNEDNFLINFLVAALAGATVVLFSWLCTRRIKTLSPIDAIRSGETGERFQKRGILQLGKSRMPIVSFMSWNDILNGRKSYFSMTIIFILGTLLVTIPVNIVNTLRSDRLITTFNMVKSDHVISKELLLNANVGNAGRIDQQFVEIREMFSEQGIQVDVFQEILFRSNVRKGDKLTNSLSFQGRGQVTPDMYTYMKGTAPQNAGEVALTYLTAGQIGAEIGDDVEIRVGRTTKTYLVTAITQSMNNMGEGVRFHPDEKLDYDYAAGSFGIQVNYRDAPDRKTLEKRKAMLKKLYPDADIYTSGGYVAHMIGGDVVGQLDSMKLLILSIILGINTLVAVLMVKSFITREKGEIALLKAIGFNNTILTLIQTMRIGVMLLISVIIGVLLSPSLTSLVFTPVFRMLGAYSIEFEIREMEVYVAYPLIMLAVTSCSAFLSAQSLRRISAREISNIE